MQARSWCLTALSALVVVLGVPTVAPASGTGGGKDGAPGSGAVRGTLLPCPVSADDDDEVVLFDSSGLKFDIDRFEGYVEEGGDANEANFEDAYDDLGYAYVSEVDNESDYDSYDNAGGGCTLEDGGREIVFPKDDDVNGQGVDIERKVFVPASGLPFARWLDILTNPSDEPLTINYDWYGDYGEISEVTDSTDGDTTTDLGERWSSFLQDDPDDDQIDQASLWDGPDAADGWDHPYEDDEGSIPGNDGNDTVDYIYESVTIPPRSRAIFMHIEHQNRTAGGAQAFADANGDGAGEFFAGMSSDELRDLRNWRPDVDGDGVLDSTDNCDETANGDQADLDGDGLGDACDDDTDGDGLDDGAERGLGLDPRGTDTDGDGVPDGLDRCGTKAGTDGQGCPVTAVTLFAPSTQGFVRRLRPNRLTLKTERERTRRGLRVKSSGRLLLPAGLTPAQACRTGSVAVQAKSGKRTISTRVVALKADCTYRSAVTFGDRRRLGGRALRIFARFTGNERLFRRNSAGVSAGRR